MITPLLISALVCVLLFKIIKSILKWRQLVKELEWIPGPPAWPILGNINLITMSHEEIFKLKYEYAKKYGGIYKLWIGMVPQISISDPYYIKLFLTENSNVFKASFYDILKQTLGNGLIHITGSKWHHRRKLLTPSFHYEVLNTLPELIAPDFTACLESLKPYSENRKVLDVVPFMKNLFLDVIMNSSFGVKLENNKGQLFSKDAYLEAVEWLSDLFVTKLFSPHYQLDWIYRLTPLWQKEKKATKIFSDYGDLVIRSKLELSNANPRNNDTTKTKRKRHILFDTLLNVLNKENGVTEQELKDEINMFVFAGHDTLSMASSYSLFLLGNYPDVQEKLYQEIKEYLGDINGRIVEFQELGRLPYLDCVVKESLRIYPPGDIIGRHTMEPVVTDLGTIPKDVDVLIDIYSLHRLETNWPEPDKFDPDRFLPEESAGRDPFLYLPFSAGSRNCIGIRFAQLELKMLLVMVLSRYKIISQEKPEDLTLVSNIIVKSLSGIKLKIEPRELKGK